MTIIQRAQAPTPRFFKRVRSGGLIMTAIGASLLAASNLLPPGLLKLAGYLTVAGSVATAVSQVTTAGDEQTTPGTGSSDGQ